jgi:hypothetical protein
MSLSYRNRGPSIAIWISGVIDLAQALTMILRGLGIGLVISIIGLVALGIFAILPAEDRAAP